MNLFHPARMWGALCSASILVACASVTEPPAEAFKKYLASGYLATVKVADAASALLKSGGITSAEARDIANKNDTAMLTLDRAKFLHATDPAGANARLTEATAALTAIQADLEAKAGQVRMCVVGRAWHRAEYAVADCWKCKCKSQLNASAPPTPWSGLQSRAFPSQTK